MIAIHVSNFSKRITFAQLQLPPLIEIHPSVSCAVRECGKQRQVFKTKLIERPKLHFRELQLRYITAVYILYNVAGLHVRISR